MDIQHERKRKEKIRLLNEMAAKISYIAGSVNRNSSSPAERNISAELCSLFAQHYQAEMEHESEKGHVEERNIRELQSFSRELKQQK